MTFQKKKCTRRSKRHLIFCVVLGGALLAALSPLDAWAESDSLLYDIVHRCVVSAEDGQQPPPPCQYVDVSTGERNGYAVLKDKVGIAQFLVVPTRRIIGIESPELLSSDVPNYWRAAWEARKYLESALGRDLPRSAVGLAVNSADKRSQDQLHIHIDCVRQEVANELLQGVGKISDDWSEFPNDLVGRRFVARKIQSANLEGENLFQLLATSDEKVKLEMLHKSIVVVGFTFSGSDGFIALAEFADPALPGSGQGEDLLDHECAALKDGSGFRERPF